MDAYFMCHRSVYMLDSILEIYINFIDGSNECKCLETGKN